MRQVKHWIILMGAISVGAWVFSCAVLTQEGYCDDSLCGNSCENDAGCLSDCICIEAICEFSKESVAAP